MMDKKTWLGRITKLLQDFGNAEYQKRVWADGRGPECSSWEEHLCMFFDDTDIENFIENYATDFGLNEAQREALAGFYSILDSYSNKCGSDIDVRKLLADPEWHQIQAMARDVFQLFREYEIHGENRP